MRALRRARIVLAVCAVILLAAVILAAGVA